MRGVEVDAGVEAVFAVLIGLLASLIARVKPHNRGEA
jgi:hypothetical protein